ncbi:MAG: polysaccharide biosynthesis/export family protein [Niastella sp.]|nr:polysaccharide biosynthesis/export family protein [Niastella sp.]
MALFIWAFSSCSTTRNYTYLKNIHSDTSFNDLVSKDFESKIKAGDLLSIKATSLSPAEDDQFNKAAAIGNGQGEGAGYLVEPDGTLLFHRLGRVQVAGLTRRELAAQLQQSLLGYMKEPVVTVNFSNHRITVMGAVGTPRVIPMPEEQMNLFEALVQSGDIKEEGIKDRVMLIRQDNSRKTIKILNLEDHSILTSPYFYLKPDDVILVKADTKNTEAEQKRRNIQTTMALAASGITLVVLLIDRVFK